MKFVDKLFLIILIFYCIVYNLFQSIPRDTKLHVDPEIGVAFVTNVSRKYHSYGGGSIKFSTGEDFYIPSNKEYHLKDNRVLIIINYEDRERGIEILDAMLEKGYFDTQNFNVIVLPFNVEFNELKYVYLRYDVNQKDGGQYKQKIKKHSLKHVPLVTY